MMAGQEVRWCVEERDTGIPCAGGSAPTEEAASREMMHYAMQYGQDGPVRYWMRQNRKMLAQGEIEGVNVTMKRTDGGDLRKLLAGQFGSET